MSKKSVIIYEDWADTIRALPDEQAIQVIRGLIGYAFYDESLDGIGQIAKAILSPWCKDIDRNMASYKAKVENMNANRKKSQEKKESEISMKSAKKQAEIISKDKDDDVDKDKDVKKEKVKKEKSIHELLMESDLSEEVKINVNLWIAYKAEQHKFTYKPIGFKSFLTEVSNQVSAIGERNVLKAIQLSMGKGYKGVIWELIKDDKPTNKVAQQLDDSYKMINEWGNDIVEGSDSVVDGWG